jgi:hypothetical protein
LERQYLRAARDFLTRTRAYVRDDLPPLPSVAEQPAYSVSVNVDEEIFDTLDMWFAGTYKVQKGTRRKDRAHRLTTPGVPAYYTLRAPGELVFTPPPAETGQEFTFLACIRPTMTATALADHVVSKYMEVLEHGALAYTLRQPNQEWTDYKGAGVQQTLFDDAIDAHRSSAVDEEQRGVIRTVRYGGYPTQ